MQSSSNQIGIRFPNPDKSLQSESENLFLDHIHGEDKNVDDVQIADHLRPMEKLLQIPIIAGGNLMSKNTQEAITIIENKAKVQTFRNKPHVSSNDGTSTQIDAIATLTKQVEALGYHISSMQETYDCNQEAVIQLMQIQMGQMAEALQERSSCVPPSNIVTKPYAELKAITIMNGLTLKGSLIPHSNLLVYQEEEQEQETIKEVALEHPTGRADHFIDRIDIIDSFYDKFPIENNSLSGNPNPSSDLVVAHLLPHKKSSGNTTSHFDHSLLDYEAFCFDVDHQEEKSSGNTTSHSDLSLPNYESFFFDIDHQEEKSSGSTTSESDHSLPDYEAFCFEEKSSGSTISHFNAFILEYESFYFDLSIDLFLLPKGVIFILRSSSMNSLTSYLHRSMIIFTLILRTIHES
uniref:Reverse transcriptase domain-containing protein n=1 Tax=Tanacetum cinerariifolium TaxID=118510 RepID=A0A699HBN0_TANCI|nr:hypothetical protein [Tanacetum cinerariifolium]